MEQWQVFKKTSHSIWEVSNYGNIRKNGKDYIPYEKGGIKGNRYSCISINDPFGGYIHRIVAYYFVPNPEGKPTVNHKDGNKKNNNVNNLEWQYYDEQACHAIDMGLSNRYCSNWDGTTPYHKYITERRVEILRLRRSGYSLDQISKFLQISLSLIFADLIKCNAL